MSSGMPPEYGLAPPLHEVKKTRKGPWIFFLVVALLAIGAAIYGGRAISALNESIDEGTASGSHQEPPPSTPPTPPKRVVVFEVTGTGKAFNITATVGAYVQNESSVALPWTRTVEVPADPASASVMLVVVAGTDGAEVRGKYTIDGRTVREGKASGPYGVLTITDS